MVGVIRLTPAIFVFDENAFRALGLYELCDLLGFDTAKQNMWLCGLLQFKHTRLYDGAVKPFTEPQTKISFTLFDLLGEIRQLHDHIRVVKNPSPFLWSDKYVDPIDRPSRSTPGAHVDARGVEVSRASACDPHSDVTC